MSKGYSYKEAPIEFPGRFTLMRQSPTGSWRVQRPVIDQEKCTSCGLCRAFCPDVAVKSDSGVTKVDYMYCKGCGICANECPVKAISMIREE